MENGGNVSRAMRDANLSDAYASNPQKMKASKGWQELLDEYIPEDLLQQKLKEGLGATKTLGETPEVDFQTRHKYLDTAFKLRGSYAAEKKDLTTNGKPINFVLNTDLFDKYDSNGNTEDGSEEPS